MNKKNIRKGILIAFAISILVLIGFLGSYAYFILNTTGRNQELSLTTGNVSIIFSDGSSNFTGALTFGGRAEKTFKLENNGSVGTTINFFWEDLVNTYLSESLSYVLEESDSENGEYSPVIPERNVPRSETPSSQTLASNIFINTGETKYYKLTITLNYLEEIDQTPDLNAILSTHFNIKETIFQNGMMARVDDDKFWKHSSDIKKVVFEASLNPKENASYTYDISANQNESVMSYLVPDPEDNSKYTLYIQSDGMTVANPNSSYLFEKFSQLETIENLNNLDTSKVTNMDAFFSNCKNLTSIDVSSFNTSNVTSMFYMFNMYDEEDPTLSKLEEIKGLENFDTSNVTDMAAMFQECIKLRSLNVSNFKTSKVIDMGWMFGTCKNLQKLDLSNFDTSKVTSMSCMFGDCNNLQNLNISNFNTSNVTDMSYMFYECNLLKTIEISNFITSKVTTMQQMFQGCQNLTIIDLGNFDTSNVITMQQMFYNCKNLISINLINFDTSKVTNMKYMFGNCNSLTSLDVSNFKTGNVTDMEGMFYGYNEAMKLTEIKGIENFDTTNVTNMAYMFKLCNNITSLDLSNFNTSRVTNMRSMFNGCSKLEALNLSNFEISLVTDYAYFLSYVPSTIKVTLNSDNVKQWIMSTAPLTDDNFIMI